MRSKETCEVDSIYSPASHVSIFRDTEGHLQVFVGQSK